MKERSLILFTIFSQAAVGIFAVSFPVFIFISRLAPSIAMEFTRWNWRAALLLIGMGLLASFFHLGTPLKGWRAIANLRSSWLSWEILCAVLFGLGSAVFAGLNWYRIGPPPLYLLLGSLIVFIGLGLVYCMAGVYRLRTVPGWDAPATPLSFFLTTFLTGGLATLLCLNLAGFVLPCEPKYLILLLYPPLETISRWIALVVLLLLCVQFYFLFTGAGRGQSRSAPQSNESDQQDRSVTTLRLALVFAAAALTGVLLYQPARYSWLAGLALGIVTISEFIGRSHFYETGLDRAM